MSSIVPVQSGSAQRGSHNAVYAESRAWIRSAPPRICTSDIQASEHSRQTRDRTTHRPTQTRTNKNQYLGNRYHTGKSTARRSKTKKKALNPPQLQHPKTERRQQDINQRPRRAKKEQKKQIWKHAQQER
jgi:hypothetical protein